MKKLFVLLVLIGISYTYAQQTPVEQMPPTWKEYPTCYVLEGRITGLDSGVTVYTSPFDASYIVSRLLESNMNAYTARDTTILPYIHSNDIWITLRVQSGNSTDSLSKAYYQSIDMSGNATTIDTLKTRKRNAINTTLSYGTDLPIMRQGRFQFTGADLTVSGYNMTVEYQVVIPKKRY